MAVKMDDTEGFCGNFQFLSKVKENKQEITQTLLSHLTHLNDHLIKVYCRYNKKDYTRSKFSSSNLKLDLLSKIWCLDWIDFPIQPNFIFSTIAHC